MNTSPAIPHLTEMVVASTRYLGALTDLTDEDMRASSLLPGWSRGHVVTHLARNADGLCNLLHWAETGVEKAMYPSKEQRDADIEMGATRTAHDLRVDSAASAGRLLQAVNELHVAHEDAPVSRTIGGASFPARDIALIRRIELEVHHADLDLGFSHADWDLDFVHLLVERIQGDRAEGASMLLKSTDSEALWRYGAPGEGAEVSGSASDLAWWVLGRGQGSGLVSSIGELPELPKWR